MPPIDEGIRFVPIRIAVMTVSDTRTHADDISGDTLAGRIADAGHELAARAIVKDRWDSILRYPFDTRHKPCNFAEIMPRLTEK